SIVMSDGVTNYNPALGAIYFGEKTNIKPYTQRVNAIADLFTSCNLNYRINEDMIKAIWFKYMCNIGENLTCALLGIPFGAFRTSGNANFIRLAAMREVIAVANKLNINLSEEDIKFQENVVKAIPFENKPSTLQDLESHKLTEIHMFAGRIMELGKELDVATPINEIFYYGIRTLEEKPFENYS
ncbi:MAG: ketopantoate reductase C-terminal domain-containing protein, partial [Eubacteriales bacterium]